MFIQEELDVRWASYCFPIEMAGRQDIMHIIAQTSINNLTLKIGKQREAHVSISGYTERKTL